MRNRSQLFDVNVEINNLELRAFDLETVGVRLTAENCVAAFRHRIQNHMNAVNRRAVDGQYAIVGVKADNSEELIHHSRPLLFLGVTELHVHGINPETVQATVAGRQILIFKRVPLN